MGLIERITQFFKGQPAKTTPPPDTASERPPLPMLPQELVHRLGAERERLRIIQVCNEMYEDDPRCEQAINTLARDVARGGCTVETSDTQAGDIAAALFDRLKLTSRLDDWLRETFIDGDTFLETGAGEAPEARAGDGFSILSATRKPVRHMRRNTDRFDHFTDPARAYWYDERQTALWSIEPPQDAIWFAEWQIVHVRWNRRSERRYGRPLFASAIKAYRRLEEGELDIAVRRKSRAGMKYHHVVEGDEADIEAYKERNKAAFDNPFAAQTDFFSNKAGGITALQGDARLQEIGDVVHQMETWWTATPVPIVLVGYGKDLNRDVLEQKLAQYERALEQLTQWAEDEVVVPLLEREWLLHGLYPPSISYEVAWKQKEPTSAADLSKIADAVLRFKALGVPDELIWSIVARYLPWLDLTAILEAAQQVGSDTLPAQIDQNLAAQAGPA